MNFNLSPAMVRGELFTPTGKWKYTIQIDMTGYWEYFPLHEAIIKAVRKTPVEIRGVVDGAVGPDSEYILVVFDPYHKNGYPQMIRLSQGG